MHSKASCFKNRCTFVFEFLWEHRKTISREQAFGMGVDVWGLESACYSLLGTRRAFTIAKLFGLLRFAGPSLVHQDRIVHVTCTYAHVPGCLVPLFCGPSKKEHYICCGGGRSKKWKFFLCELDSQARLRMPRTRRNWVCGKREKACVYRGSDPGFPVLS